MKNRLEELQGITIPYEEKHKDLSIKVTEVIHSLSLSSIESRLISSLYKLNFTRSSDSYKNFNSRLCYQYNKCISTLCGKAKDVRLNAGDLTEVLHIKLLTSHLNILSK